MTEANFPVSIMARLLLTSETSGRGIINSDVPIKNRAKVANPPMNVGALNATPDTASIDGQTLNAEKNPSAGNIKLGIVSLIKVFIPMPFTQYEGIGTNALRNISTPSTNSAFMLICSGICATDDIAISRHPMAI